jgi:hypothetical protein
MAFSRKCLRILHILATQAWQKHCGDEGLRVKDSAAQDAWYRGVLREKFGVESSLQLKTRQFAHACAAFEIIARNGIYWQLQADSGAIRRARYALNTLMANFELDEPYVQATSRQMFSMKLENLNPDQIGDLIAALKIHLDRHALDGVYIHVDEPF